MASRFLDALTAKGGNQIGSLNTMWTKHMANGAIATEDIQNYTLAEIAWVDGVLTCKKLSDPANKGYLVTTVEEDQLFQELGFSETYRDFYNAEGEIIRITDVDAQKNSRFETSAISAEDATTVAEGQFAYWDVATGTYKITTDLTDLDAVVNKFEVVDADTMLGYSFDVPTIRLMSL